MMRDPLTTWDGPFPYDVLAAVGITPRSTHAEVLDAGYELFARGATPETRAAWDTLRLVQRRMVADFLLHPVDPRAEAARLLAEIDRAMEEPDGVVDVRALLTAELHTLTELLDDPFDLALDPPDAADLPAVPELPPPIPPATDLIAFDR